jgi:predicted HTH domain antitoxin
VLATYLIERITEGQLSVDKAVEIAVTQLAAQMH